MTVYKNYRKKKKKKMSVQIGMVGYFHLHGIFLCFSHF